MTFKQMAQREWFAIGRNVFAQGADGPPVLVAVVDETPDSNPAAPPRPPPSGAQSPAC